MVNLNDLKNRQKLTTEKDLCFYSGEFLKNPIEVFHPLIGFISISGKYKQEVFNLIEQYEYQNKSKNN